MQHMWSVNTAQDHVLSPLPAADMFSSSGLFTCLATCRDKGMKEKEESSPEQWEGRWQAGKGVCGLGRDGGSWEMAVLSPAQRRWGSCCMCGLCLFLYFASKTAWISWYAPSRFCCSTLFHFLVYPLQFLNEVIAGLFPKTARGLEYVPLSPTVTSRSSHISNRKHSIATCIFLRNLWWTSYKWDVSQFAVYFSERTETE